MRRLALVLAVAPVVCLLWGLMLVWVLSDPLQESSGICSYLAVGAGSLLVGTAIALVGLRSYQVGLRRSLETLQVEAEAARSRASEIEGSLRELGYEKRLFSSIFYSLPDGVFCVNELGTIIYQNASLGGGLLAANASGRPYFKAVRHPDLLEYVKNIVEPSIGRKPAHDSEPVPESARFRSADEYFSVLSVQVGQDSPGTTVFLFVVRNRTEEANIQRMREEFLANAEHELKTPITSIRGYAETLQTRFDQEPFRGFLDAILRNALRMERLVEDMVTISSVESREYAPQPERLIVGDFLESIEGLVGGLLEVRAQHLKLEVEPNLEVVMDRMLLEQLLLNLIGNASRYGPQGSQVRVSARRDPSGRLRLCVADEGSGIPVEFRTKIFERFFRIDRDRSRKDGGTGLGLSIVRHIVHLHGGRVWVDDAPEGGAQFHVLL